MTRSDIPDNWHDLIAGYTLGNLTPAEQAQLEQLLQAHPELHPELQAYESAMAQLPQILPEQPPSADLEATILRALHLEQRDDERPALQLVQRPFPVGWGVGAAIAAGLIAALGWSNYQMRQEIAVKQQALSEANQQVQQLQENQRKMETVLASLRVTDKTVHSLQGTGALAGASGNVITLAQERRAVLVLYNVPSLPPQQVYRMWADTPADEDLLYCGQFSPQEDDTVELLLPHDGCSGPAQQVLITVDPITAPTDSGGELVMQSLSSAG